MKLLARLEKCCEVWMLLSILFGFFLLRLPSLYEPYWYGDEGIYEVIGKALLAGRPLYGGIWDNKPPLLYTLYAIFQADQFTIRFVSLLFGLGAIVSFFYLARMLFKKHALWAITTSIFAILLATPVIEGNIANAENFMVLPILFAAFLVYQVTQTSITHKINTTKIALAGLLLGIALLFKIVGIFDFAAMLTFLGFVFFAEKSSEKEHLEKLRSLGLFILTFILPFILTSIFFLVTQQFSPYIEALFFSNVGYVGWKNNFIIPQGFLLFKVALLTGAVSILFRYRKNVTIAEIFIFIWVFFSVFNAFFSQRPYIHYQLVLLPSLSLLIGLLLQRYAPIKKLLFVFFIICILLLVHKSFDRWTVKRTVAYYDNFIQFMLHKKSLTAYQSFFDNNTPRDYQLAYYIKSHTGKHDNVFVWGNSAQIYVLADKLPPGRYTVAYHIGNNKKAVAETEKALQKAQPKYIIMMPDIAYYPFALHNYEYKVTIDNTHIYEKIL